eukprot:COSAG01_NODE_7345_length_3242_cov_6.925867_2_plen_138_part_00
MIAVGLRTYYYWLNRDFEDAVKEGALTGKYHDEQLAETIAQPLGYAGSTLRQTYHVQFTKFEGFRNDGRGGYDRDWIMQESDLLLTFKHYMMSVSYLTIDTCTAWVNSQEFLAAEDHRLLLTKYKLTLPINRDKVYR